MNGSIMNPKISVIIPVYNVENYLKEAIDSVILQSSTPYEVIIIDDGSTDSSGHLLEKYYSSFPFIKILHTKNNGLGEARNVGIRIATGDYIYFFDSDDIAVNGLLETFTKVYSENVDIDIFCFSAKSFFDENKSTTHKSSVLPTYNRGERKIYPDGISAFNSMSINNRFFPNAWLYIFSRNIILDNGIFFKAIIHEDEEFSPKLFFHAKKVYVTDTVFFQRRVRFGSIMQTKKSEANAIGYIESVIALKTLLYRVDDYPTKKHLIKRIQTNLMNVIHIKKMFGVKYSDKTNRDFVLLKNEYANMPILIADHCYFLYRCLRFARTRVVNIISCFERK